MKDAKQIFMSLEECTSCPAKKLCDDYCKTGNDPDCVDIIDEQLRLEGTKC